MFLLINFQLNLKYKMDYSAYVDKLSPEEKEVFLAKGGVKRPASKSEVSFIFSDLT